MKNTLNNKNYINIYQYFGHKVRQAERPPKIDEIIILYVYTKCLLEKIPSLSNLYRSFILNNRSDSSLYAPRDGLHLNSVGTSTIKGKVYQTCQCKLYIHFIY
jgi:hypothetical protein